MAHFNSRRDDEQVGDRTLVEEILYSIFGEEDADKEQQTEDGERLEEEEIDMQKLLWPAVSHETTNDVDDTEQQQRMKRENNFDEDNEAIQFLFRRPDLFYTKKLPNVEDSNGKEESSTILFTETDTTPLSGKRPRFVQAHNDEYRQLMEEFMLIKCCSKEIMDYLDEIKALLGRHIEVKNEPGIHAISVVEGWTWILKEAIAISYSVTSKDRKRRKFLEMFMEKLLHTLQNSFKQFHSDISHVVKGYHKLEKEMASLVKKCNQTFYNNLEGARHYEKNSSGYEFFLHRSDEGSDVSLHGHEKLERKNDLDNKTVAAIAAAAAVDPDHSLLVRCSVDGITLRSGKPGCSWHKFQSVDQDQDKQVFMKIFANALSHISLNAEGITKLVKDLLEAHQALKNDAKESICRSISHCMKILEKHKKIVKFLPKEEVVLLYSMNSMAAAFNLIKPLLTEFVMASDKVFCLIEELSRTRKILRGNGKVGRVPIHKHSSFQIEVLDTNINIDLILNRYPNLYNAKQLRDKIFQNQMNGESVPDDIFLEEPKLEMLYKCPSQVFCSPSTQEMISLIRKLIVEQAEASSNSPNPNPAHLLFADFEAEYVETATALVETRKLTPEALDLCSDPIKNFHAGTEEMAVWKDKIVAQLVSAIENLLFTETYPDNIADGSAATATTTTTTVPTYFWIQLICRTIHIWDFHSLPKHLQSHFHAVYEASMKWMGTLTGTFSELTDIVERFKVGFLDYCRSIEDAHKFSTWIKKKFTVNPPDQIISKWRQELCEQSKFQLTSDEKIADSSPTPLRIDFNLFDMELVQIDPSDATETVLLTLNKTSDNVQVGLVSILLTYFDQIISGVVVSLNSALSTFQQNLSLKPLKNSISIKGKASLPQFNRLEDIVLALSFETLHRNMKEISAYLELVGKTVSQFQKMFQMVQLHLEDRAIINTKADADNLSSSVHQVKKKLSKKKMNAEMEHRNHDKYLNETVQLLRTSVKAMPSTFEISDGPVKHSLLHWVKLAEKDSRLKEIISKEEVNSQIQRNKIIVNRFSPPTEKRYMDVSSTSNLNCPIDFEEAMMLTTTGKAFFPDPIQFNANIELWRSVCFKMLSAALERFREITTTKINESRKILCQPRKSKHGKVDLKSNYLQDTENKPETFEGNPVPPNSDDCDSAAPTLSLDNISDNEKSTPVPDPVPSAEYHVGFAEGLCSLLCFMTSHLTSRDSSVPFEEVKYLKNKFFAVTSLIEKFQKDVDSMEKVLKNSLGSSMTVVERKNLPKHLSQTSNTSEALKGHDLEEVASKLSLQQDDSKLEQDGEEEGNRSESDGDINLSQMQNAIREENEVAIELRWDSSNKQNLFCRSTADKFNWFDFSQLNITGQLQILHILLDKLIQEFEIARELVMESKLDLTCAKKLLEKSWKGIGKDMKKGRIPDSGVFVLVKLYRYQIETAVHHSNVIKRTIREVRFLLSQSAHRAKIWATEDIYIPQNSPPDKNYIMSLDNLTLTLTLRLPIPPEYLLMMKEDDDTRMGAPTTQIGEGRPKENNILDIKNAVRVKSSMIFGVKDELTLPRSALHQSLRILDQTSRTIRPLAERTVIVGADDDSDFYSAALSIEKCILSQIEENAALLKFPNSVLPNPFPGSNAVTSEKHAIPNIVGVAAAFGAVAMRIRSYKDIVPLQRNYLMDRLRNVQVKLNKIHSPNFGICEQLLEESKKIKKSVATLDTDFRSRFCFKEEFPPLKDVCFGPSHPNYGITPLEFIEGLAAAISGYLWTIMIGIPEIGAVIRDNKSLESHAIINLPMSAKLEILLSLIHFIEKLTEYVQSSMETMKKDFSSAKKSLKSHAKRIKSRNKKFFSRIGIKTTTAAVVASDNPKNSDNVMSKWEIEEFLQSFARIASACIRAEENLSQISGILSGASEVLQQVFLYISLRFKVEPPGGLPTVSPNDVMIRSQAWGSVEVISGLVQPPIDVPPPVILKKNVKQHQLRESAELKYKTAMEHKILELELCFEQFCSNHRVSIDVPMMLLPRATSEEECCVDE